MSMSVSITPLRPSKTDIGYSNSSSFCVSVGYWSLRDHEWAVFELRRVVAAKKGVGGPMASGFFTIGGRLRLFRYQASTLR